MFDTEGNLLIGYAEALDKLLIDRKEGVSMVDAYLNSVILPCGAIHQDTLKMFQNESLQRLAYKEEGNVLEDIKTRLTWHDVVLWFMLVDLTKRVGYNPTQEELSVMKLIYKICTEKDARRFKTLLGLMYMRGGDERTTPERTV